MANKDAQLAEDIVFQREKSEVTCLGEKIGYGNMMYLASSMGVLTGDFTTQNTNGKEEEIASLICSAVKIYAMRVEKRSFGKYEAMSVTIAAKKIVKIIEKCEKQAVHKFMLDCDQYAIDIDMGKHERQMMTIAMQETFDKSFSSQE